MLRITYFVHASTTDNEKHLATGWQDGELSELGIKQAKALGEQNQTKFDAVFSSDLKRAMDTARLAFGGSIQDKRLREADYGDCTGKPSKSFKADMTKFIDDPYPNGESYKDVEKRVRDFLISIKDKYRHIAIVAHQGPQLALDVILKGKTWEQAIKEDWRKDKKWKPGWEYILRSRN